MTTMTLVTLLKKPRSKGPTWALGGSSNNLLCKTMMKGILWDISLYLIFILLHTFFFPSSFLLIVMFTLFSLFLCWTICISIANILNPMEKKNKNNMHWQRVLSHVLIIKICNKMVVRIAPPNGNWEYDFSQSWRYCTILYMCMPLIKN